MSYYKLFPSLDPYSQSNVVFPSVSAQAMIAGTQHFMTFDRNFFEFQGSCSYLLTQDFVDRNFSLVITFNPNSKVNTHELALIIGKQVVQVNVFEDVSIQY